jgi:pyridoxal phosphate enzyme (YggS family)
LPKRLHDNLRAVRERIDAACVRAGRPPGCVDLVAVTKYVPAPACADLLALGQLDLGESRAQALAPKAAWCAERGLDVRWHFIGHLQRNKARAVVRVAHQIHSVDSARLLEALERVAAEEQRRPGVYLEVDFTAAARRTGLAPQEAERLVARAAPLEHVELLGLMTMAPPPDERASDPLGPAREVFGRLAEMRQRIDPAHFPAGRCRLSMGMTSDLEAAVEAGADVVRVGSALFEGLEVGSAAEGGRP